MTPVNIKVCQLCDPDVRPKKRVMCSRRSVRKNVLFHEQNVRNYRIVRQKTSRKTSCFIKNRPEKCFVHAKKRPEKRIVHQTPFRQTYGCSSKNIAETHTFHQKPSLENTILVKYIQPFIWEETLFFMIVRTSLRKVNIAKHWRLFS